MPALIPPYPALYLYPLGEPFTPKHIALHNSSGAQQRVKIGRQTNAKSAPSERNGYFDSKVLSRSHAEVWEEEGKIFIRDVSSSNGTFINGERLSPESKASEPFELKSDDIVEFGIDIVGEDNKTIIHHKVAARVVCVFTEQDVQVATRAEQHQQSSQQYQPASQAGSTSMLSQPGPSGPNGAGAFNFNQGNRQQRPQLAQQGLTGMGGMGGSMRPPGKTGLTFDHILSRLQTELQKSRETGAELHTLTGTMSEINDTLGGNLPSNLPPYPSVLPPVRTSQSIPLQQHPAQGSQAGSPEQPSTAPSAALTASALVELQSQLQDTRISLTSHVDKIRELEGALAEQESIKQEIRVLREMMESKHQEMEDHKRKAEPPGGFDDEEDGGPSHYDDDNESVATAMPHELESVEEEDEEQLALDAQEEERYRASEQHAAESQTGHGDHLEEDRHSEQEVEDIEDEEERRRRSKELGRPRTPEPTNLGMRDEEFASHVRKHLNARASASSPLSQIVTAGTSPSPRTEEMIEQVLNQVSALVALTSSLEAQHAAAQSTIQALETKVSTLEAQVKASQEAVTPNHVETQTSPPTSPVEPKTAPLPDEREQERENLTAMVMEWKKAMEGQWTSVKEDWDKERERLNAAREQWEGQKRTMDAGLEKLASLQSNAATAFQRQQQWEQERDQRDQERRRQELALLANGDLSKPTGGLVTPPSPRSLSSDSNRPRRRKSGSRRGRSTGRSRSKSGERERELDTESDATLASEGPSPLKEKGKSIVHSRPSSPSRDLDDDDDEEEVTVLGIRRKDDGATTLPTPSISDKNSESNRSVSDDGEVTASKVAVRDEQTALPVQTAIGVLVLGIAAAAVMWRVRPQS